MTQTIKIKKSSIPEIVAELKLDPMFSSDWQKEIGIRLGRPSDDGNYNFTLGVTGLHPWACTKGFFYEPRWYEAVFAKHAEK